MRTVPELQRCTRMLNLRLTESEHDAFGRIADQLKTTRSELVRKMIREVIGQGPDLLANDLTAMQQAAYQVGCVGRNLNQLLRIIYTGRVPTPGDLRAVIEALSDRVDRLHEELTRVIDRSYERWVVIEKPPL